MVPLAPGMPSSVEAGSPPDTRSGPTPVNGGGQRRARLVSVAVGQHHGHGRNPRDAAHSAHASPGVCSANLPPPDVRYSWPQLASTILPGSTRAAQASCTVRKCRRWFSSSSSMSTSEAGTEGTVVGVRSMVGALSPATTFRRGEVRNDTPVRVGRSTPDVDDDARARTWALRDGPSPPQGAGAVRVTQR